MFDRVSLCNSGFPATKTQGLIKQVVALKGWIDLQDFLVGFLAEHSEQALQLYSCRLKMAGDKFSSVRIRDRIFHRIKPKLAECVARSVCGHSGTPAHPRGVMLTG